MDTTRKKNIKKAAEAYLEAREVKKNAENVLSNRRKELDAAIGRYKQLDVDGIEIRKISVEKGTFSKEKFIKLYGENAYDNVIETKTGDRLYVTKRG